MVTDLANFFSLQKYKKYQFNTIFSFFFSVCYLVETTSRDDYHPVFDFEFCHNFMRLPYTLQGCCVISQSSQKLF